MKQSDLIFAFDQQINVIFRVMLDFVDKENNNKTRKHIKRALLHYIDEYKNKDNILKYMEIFHNRIEPLLPDIAKYNDLMFCDEENPNKIDIFIGLDIKEVWIVLLSMENNDDIKNDMYTKLQQLYVTSHYTIDTTNKSKKQLKKSKVLLNNIIESMKVNAEIDVMEHSDDEDNSSFDFSIDDLFGKDNPMTKVILKIKDEIKELCGDELSQFESEFTDTLTNNDRVINEDNNDENNENQVVNALKDNDLQKLKGFVNTKKSKEQLEKMVNLFKKFSNKDGGNKIKNVIKIISDNFMTNLKDGTLTKESMIDGFKNMKGVVMKMIDSKSKDFGAMLPIGDIKRMVDEMFNQIIDQTSNVDFDIKRTEVMDAFNKTFDEMGNIDDDEINQFKEQLKSLCSASKS